MWPDVDVDVLEDGRYVVEVSPAYKLWCKAHLGIGVSAKAKYEAREGAASFTLKFDKGGPLGGLRKIKALPAKHRVELHTRKLEVGVLRASGVVTHDLERKSASLSWRLSSMWSADGGKIGRKEKVPLGGGLMVDYKWNCSFSLPELGGTAGGDGASTRVNVDSGKFRYSIEELGLGYTFGQEAAAPKQGR